MIKKNNLTKIYRKLGIKSGDSLYVTGNFGKLGFFDTSKKFNNHNIKKRHTLNEHYKTLKEIIGNKGTVFFPTHSWQIINNKQLIFDLNSTTCNYIFSEFLRKKSNSYRYYHPFNSIGAIGFHAPYLEKIKSKNSYGQNTPFDLMAKLKCKHLSIGLEANLTCTEVHHCEYLAKVPYRYLKLFKQKCLIKNKVYEKNFYLYVWKRSLKIIRDKNIKIFKKKEIKEILIKNKYNEIPIEIFDINLFIKYVVKYMKDDPNIWVRKFS